MQRLFSPSSVDREVSSIIKLFKPKLSEWMATELNAKVNLQNEKQFVKFWVAKLQSYHEGHLYQLYQQMSDSEKQKIRDALSQTMCTPYVIQIALGNLEHMRNATAKFDMLEMVYDFDLDQLYNYIEANQPNASNGDMIELKSMGNRSL